MQVFLFRFTESKIYKGQKFYFTKFVLACKIILVYVVFNLQFTFETPLFSP